MDHHRWLGATTLHAAAGACRRLDSDDNGRGGGRGFARLSGCTQFPIDTNAGAGEGLGTGLGKPPGDASAQALHKASHIDASTFKVSWRYSENLVESQLLFWSGADLCTLILGQIPSQGVTGPYDLSSVSVCCPTSVLLLCLLPMILSSLLHNASLVSLLQPHTVHRSGNWAHIMRALLAVRPGQQVGTNTKPCLGRLMTEVKAGSMLAHTPNLMPGSAPAVCDFSWLTQLFPMAQCQLLLSASCRGQESLC